MLRVRLLLIVMCAFCLLPLSTAAQQPPAYRITVASEPRLSGAQFSVSFQVTNNGGSASTETTVYLTELTSGTLLGSELMPALAAGESETITFTFAANTLQAGTYTIRASVDTGAGVETSVAQTSLVVPAGSSAPAQPAPTTPAATATGSGASAQVTPAPGTTTEPILSPTAPGVSSDADAQAAEQQGPLPRVQFTIPLVNFEYDSYNPLHIAGTALVVGILLVTLWVFIVLIRLIFGKPVQTFAVWQPPYASTPMIDPNSDAGRRQLWQPHAQNDAVANPCLDGSYHIRKLLLGTDSTTLSGWRVTAMRMSQYDMYGRVARSQFIVPPKLVRRLDGIARRASKLDSDKALKRVKPVARAVTAAFLKRVTKKSARLPLALDLRFNGRHGEVRILFELYGCGGAMYQLVDQWEPEMTVRKGAINENFTYTLFGQRPDETMGQFRKRLPNDLARVLAEMLTRPRAASAPPPITQVPQVQQATQPIHVPHDTLPNPTPPVDMG
jgi:hypothetical protein